LDLIKNDYTNLHQGFVVRQYPEATQAPYPDYVEEALRDAGSMSPDIAHAIISLSGNTDFRDAIHKIRARTLIINGSNDALCPISAGQWMRDRLGGVSFFIPYENCGHVPFVGRTAEKFNIDVAAFLAG
jgi:pimeloyl-ACP methyl ester carboxylesterase